MKKNLLLKTSLLMILIISSCILLSQAYNASEQIETTFPSQSLSENGQTLTDTEISSIIHDKVQSEQAEEKRHYTPISVSIAILIVGIVAFFVIRWEKKNN